LAGKTFSVLQQQWIGMAVAPELIACNIILGDRAATWRWRKHRQDRIDHEVHRYHIEHAVRKSWNRSPRPQVISGLQS
jgi:hypothetical protein